MNTSSYVNVCSIDGTTVSQTLLMNPPDILDKFTPAFAVPLPAFVSHAIGHEI
jgi:hypothetical protein